MFPENSLIEPDYDRDIHRPGTEELALLRREIDHLDEEIVSRIAERNQITLKILEIKQDDGVPSYSPDRESQVFARVKKLAASHSISDSTIIGLYQLILRQFVSPYD